MSAATYRFQPTYLCQFTIEIEPEFISFCMLEEMSAFTGTVKFLFHGNFSQTSTE
jgi:hypothetical protein